LRWQGNWILSRLRLPTAQLSATHDDLRVATLLQIMFAVVTPVPLPPLEMTGAGWSRTSGITASPGNVPSLALAFSPVGAALACGASVTISHPGGVASELIS
jgi:hypothetical protein